MTEKNCLDSSVFTYAISKDDFPQFSQHISLNEGYTLHYSPNTKVLTFKNDMGLIAIIGLCVDAHGEMNEEQIPEYLLGNGDSIEDVFRRSSRMAGKYVIYCQTKNGSYIFGDATGSVEINYAREKGSICIASSSYLIAKHFQYEPSPYSVKIRKGSNYSQGLPNDITLYSEIKALLPNHYLIIDNQERERERRFEFVWTLRLQGQQKMCI